VRVTGLLANVSACRMWGTTDGGACGDHSSFRIGLSRPITLREKGFPAVDRDSGAFTAVTGFRVAASAPNTSAAGAPAATMRSVIRKVTDGMTSHPSLTCETGLARSVK